MSKTEDAAAALSMFDVPSDEETEKAKVKSGTTEDVKKEPMDTSETTVAVKVDAATPKDSVFDKPGEKKTSKLVDISVLTADELLAELEKRKEEEKNKAAAKWIMSMDQQSTKQLVAELGKLKKMESLNSRTRDRNFSNNSRQLRIFPITPKNFMDEKLQNYMKISSKAVFQFQNLPERELFGMLMISFKRDSEYNQALEEFPKLFPGLEVFPESGPWQEPWSKYRYNESQLLANGLFLPSLPTSMKHDDLVDLFPTAITRTLVKTTPRSHAFVEFATDPEPLLEEMNKSRPTVEGLSFCGALSYKRLQELMGKAGTTHIPPQGTPNADTKAAKKQRMKARKKLKAQTSGTAPAQQQNTGANKPGQNTKSPAALMSKFTPKKQQQQKQQPQQKQKPGQGQAKSPGRGGGAPSRGGGAQGKNPRQGIQTGVKRPAPSNQSNPNSGAAQPKKKKNKRNNPANQGNWKSPQNRGNQWGPQRQNYGSYGGGGGGNRYAQSYGEPSQASSQYNTNGNSSGQWQGYAAQQRNMSYQSDTVADYGHGYTPSDYTASNSAPSDRYGNYSSFKQETTSPARSYPSASGSSDDRLDSAMKTIAALSALRSRNNMPTYGTDSQLNY